MDPRQFTHPRGRMPIRLPTYPDTRQTALVSLERITSAKIDATSGASISFALLPDPAYPVWANRVQSAITYDLTYTVTADTWLLATVPAVLSACSTSPLPLLGVYAGRPYMYTPNKALYFRLTLSGTTFTAVDPVIMKVVYYVFTAEGEVSIQQASVSLAGVVGSASTAQVSVTLKGKWVSVQNIEMVDTGTTAGDFTSADLRVQMIYAGTASAWFPDEYQKPIEWASSTEPYQACRITASELTVFNVTSTLNREGTAAAVRLQAAKIQPWDATSTNLADAPPVLRYLAPLDRGVEAFSLPANSSAAFNDYARVVIPVGTGTTVPNMDLTMAYQYVYLELTDPSTTTQTNLSLTYHEHREFCASSQLFNVGVSPYNIDQFVRVLQRVVAQPPARPAQIAAFAPMLMPKQPTRERKRAKKAKPAPQQKARTPAPWRPRANRVQWRRPRPPSAPVQKAGPRLRGGLDLYLESRARNGQTGTSSAKQTPARNAVPRR